MLGVIRFIWSYRVEVAILTLLLAIMWSLKTLPWLVSAWVCLVVLIAIVAPIRSEPFYVAMLVYRRLEWVVSAAHTRRQIVSAGRDSGFPGLRVEKVSPTLPGEIVSVRVPRGQTVDRLDAVSLAMAGCLRVAGVRVIHDREDRSHAELSIIRRDVFSQMGAAPWPLMDTQETNVRKPLPFGLDEYGRVVDLRLLSRNLILGGSPDAGKSSALRIPAAYVALDPHAKLWMMDAKTGGAEFSCWAGAAHRLVRGRDLDAAVEMLAELSERIEKRGQQIVARGEVFVCDDMEIDVLMIDELPQFTRSLEDDTAAQKSAVKTIREGIWKLIALGRWAGMPTIVSAQKPTADIVPSDARDLIDNKFALHCNTRAMSAAILGDGGGGEDSVSAVDIPSGQPGVGYLSGDHGVQKMRSFFMSHKQAMEIASRSTSRQLDVELRSMS